MEATAIQKTQISWELDEHWARRKFMNTTFDLVSPRLDKLWNNELYLEMVLIHSQVVEHHIKMMIEGYASKRRILRILGENDPHASVDIKSVDNEPLGELIKLLCKFTGKNPLIDKLGRFNNGLRRQVAHHIFDGSKKIEPFEKEIKEFFDNGTGVAFNEMMDGLYEAMIKIDGQIGEIVKSAGIEILRSADSQESESNRQTP